MDIDDERATLISVPAIEPEPQKRKRKKRKKVKNMAVLETPTMLATGGSGDGGFGGIGGGILLGALLGRGLLGNEGRREECVTNPTLTAALAGVTDALQNTTVMQTLGTIQASVPLAESQVQLALAGVNQDITSQSLQQTIALQNQGFQAQLANLAGFNSTGDKIDLLSTQSAIGFGNVNTAIERNGWAVTQAISADGEKTRALISSIDRENLNRMLTTAQNEIIELRGDQRRESDRHGVEVTMINNQNQNQMQFQQQAQVLSTLAHCLADVQQVARATNSNVIVGNTGAVGTGTQTANPTNVRA